jgi:hypothetical protein
LAAARWTGSAKLEEPIMSLSRRFYVHDCETDRQSGRVVADADDFHEAAIAFAEDSASGAGDLRVMVTDCETGEEQCFVVHVPEHEAEPC